MAGTHGPSLLRGVARRAVLILLGCAATFGLFVDAWVIMAFCSENPHGGDGLGMFFPMIAVVVLLPVQLAAALALHGASQRRKLTQQQDEPLPFTLVSAPVLDRVDDNVFERERAQRIVRRAAWMLGVPAGAMVIAALLHLVGLHSIVYVLAEPLSLLWFPSWCGGVVAAAIALGRYDQWAPLALAPLYPALSFVQL